MARTDTLEHFLIDVADSIRAKKGTSGAISCADFDTEIESISGGGDGLPIMLYYAFDNQTAGNGSGSIIAFTNNSSYNGAIKLWWADASGIMSNYSAINTMTLILTAGQTVVYQKLIDVNAIPKYATRIVCSMASDATNEIVGSYNIPSSKLWNAGNYGEHLYSVGLLSDVHYQYESGSSDWAEAFEWCAERESCSAICIAGDLTDNGKTASLNEWKTARDTVRGTKPVYSCTGNHEAYSTTALFVSDTTALRPYLDSDASASGLPYFYKEIGNDIYVFVSCFDNNQISAVGNTIFTSAQLEWLSGILETYRNQRVFLFQHVFPYTALNIGKDYQYFGNANNGYTLNLWQKSGTALSDRDTFMMLMAHYKNVIWFSGHSHMKYYLQEETNGLHQNYFRYNTDGARFVHLSSLTVPRDLIGGSASDYIYADSEGSVMDVYEDCVIIRGRNFVDEKYIGIAQYLLDTTPVIIPATVKTPVSLEASKTKTDYYTDETFSTNDVTAVVTYDDDTTDTKTGSALTYGTIDITTSGTKSLSVSYTENGTTVDDIISIVVTERPVQKELTSISATKTKTTYDVGETFSTSDVVVTAHYSDSTTANVTASATIGTVDTSTAGTKSLSVSYTEDGVTKTTAISITVTDSETYTIILDATGVGNITGTGGTGICPPTSTTVGSKSAKFIYAQPIQNKQIYYRLLKADGVSYENSIGACIGHGSTAAKMDDAVYVNENATNWTPLYIDGVSTPLTATSDNPYITGQFRASSGSTGLPYPHAIDIHIQLAIKTDAPIPDPVVPQTGTWQYKSTSDKGYVIIGKDDDTTDQAQFVRMVSGYGFPVTINTTYDSHTRVLTSDADTANSQYPVGSTSAFPNGTTVEDLNKHIIANDLGEVAQHDLSSKTIWDSAHIDDYMDGMYATYTSGGGTKTKAELKTAILEKYADTDVSQGADRIDEQRALLKASIGQPIYTIGEWGASGDSIIIDDINLGNLSDHMNSSSTVVAREKNYLADGILLHSNNSMPFRIYRNSAGLSSASNAADMCTMAQSELGAVECFCHLYIHDDSATDWNALKGALDAIQSAVNAGKVEVVTRKQFAELGEYVAHPITSLSFSAKEMQYDVGTTLTAADFNCNAILDDSSTVACASDKIVDLSQVVTSVAGTYTATLYYRGKKQTCNVTISSAPTPTYILSNKSYSGTYEGLGNNFASEELSVEQGKTYRFDFDITLATTVQYSTHFVTIGSSKQTAVTPRNWSAVTTDVQTTADTTTAHVTVDMVSDVTRDIHELFNWNVVRNTSITTWAITNLYCWEVTE